MSEKIKALDLKVGYGKKIVLDDLDFTVSAGEILTLIGPNGSGKSTILKSITGQLSLLDGAVTYLGKDLEKITPKELAKSLGIVMTERIHPELMDCREVVESGRYPYTSMLGRLSAYDREVVEGAMARTEITDLADKNFEQISDGQRQRVMLARAIAKEPEVLILDEPTSFLDIHHKLNLLTILKELVDEKQIAVIMSLHELDLAQRISDHILCVKDGHADRYGRPEEIFKDGYLDELYEIRDGVFVDIFGVAEMGKTEGQPSSFVIGDSEACITSCRKLWRQGRAFAAGILHRHDLAYPVASAMAGEVLVASDHAPADAALMMRAKNLIDQCQEVICTVDQFGVYNEDSRELLEYALKTGKSVVTVQ